MAKSSLANRIAGCGHTYTWYVFVKAQRPFCPDCLPAERARIDAVNAQRRAQILRSVSSRPRFTIARSVRLAIYERDAWTCQLCLEPVEATASHPDPWSPSLDHIVCQSWTDEPDHSPSNLRLAHLWCNVVRGDERRWTAADLAPAA